MLTAQLTQCSAMVSADNNRLIVHTFYWHLINIISATLQAEVNKICIGQTAAFSACNSAQLPSAQRHYKGVNV